MTTDFGTDLMEVDGDMDPYGRMESGPIVVAHVLIRRLSTAFLFYASGQGIDLRQLLRAGLTTSQITGLKLIVETQCELDPRVQTATAAVQYVAQTRSLNISIRVTTAAGPFTMVASIDSLDVKLLGVH
jgi:hypothetical protein